MKFVDSINVSCTEWYPRKQIRDYNARAGYRDMEKQAYHKGELYISRIIDEELGVDDLRVRQDLS